MANPNQKLKCLLSLTISMLGFGIAVAVILLDMNSASQIAALVSAFFSGWGCCYTLGVMSSGITEQVTSNQG